MVSKENNSIRSGVISGVVASIIVAALGLMWPPAQRVLSWIWHQIKVAAEQLCLLLLSPYSVAGWVLLLLGLFALATVVRFVLLIVQRAPAHEGYVEDDFHGANWRWRWNADHIVNLWSFCPQCDAELVYDDSSCKHFYSGLFSQGPDNGPHTAFSCEHCNKIVARVNGGNKEYALGAIQRLIRRKIRTGEYRPS